MTPWWQNEPVRFTAAAQAFGAAVINLCAYVMGWPGSLVVAINALWISGLSLVLGVNVRSMVIPMAKMEQTDPRAPAMDVTEL
jgi:hypothetical protein